MFSTKQRWVIAITSTILSTLMLTAFNHPILILCVLILYSIVVVGLMIDWVRTSPISFHEFCDTFVYDSARVRNRRKNVAKLHDEGKTHREIAHLTTSSIATVKRDLEVLGRVKKRKR